MATNSRERWWHDRPQERYWLEATKREDIGADLKAPLADDSNRDNWRYGLFQEARPGDVVFHYDGNSGAITSFSRIAGQAKPRPIIWAARGSYARRRGAEPKELPGYYVPLDDHQMLERPLTLDALRVAKPRLREIVDRVRGPDKLPLYFPFELKERPLRLLQGYAFKLPYDFIAEFPELVSGLGVEGTRDSAAGGAGNTEAARLVRVVAEIEAAAPEYAIGSLQELRRQLQRKMRVPTVRLFNSQTIKPEEGYAFHVGGRKELQFNIGFDEFPDGSRAFRSGVGFSFEPSQTLPDINVLVPRVRRFNDYLRQHPEPFADLAMWHFDGDRSADYAPRPVDPSLIKAKVFIFLGGRQPADAIDPSECLRTFDRLLPLYRFIEEGGPFPEEVLARPPIQLGAGKTAKTTRWARASLPQRELNILLRHNEIQERLLEQLAQRYAGADAKLEVSVGNRLIDAVLRHGDELWFYEVKTAETVRGCLREAIGQLLDYALWHDIERPTQLIVVGEPAIDDEAAAYLERLNDRFPFPVAYESCPLD